MTDYQKYINALKKCAKEHENDRTSTGHIIVSDLCRDTATLLETLEQEPRWIPISERLPKKNEEVLIYLYDRPYIAWFDDGEWQTDDFTIDVEEEPIAWMPLPQPFKAESEDKG